MATSDCDYGVTVDLENGGGGSGGNDPAVPGVQNRGSAASGDAPTTVSSFILISYYFSCMLYLIGFSKTWWHAALGIAVQTAFLVLSCCLDFSTPQELKQLKLPEKSTSQCVILVLYYFFFMFYLVGSSEYWWHAALGIVLVTGFVLLPFLLYGLQPRGCITLDDVKTPDGDGSDLSTTLLGFRN